MLEAKAKDLALFRLRTDLVRYGGRLGARFGLVAAPAAIDAGPEAEDA